MIMRFEQLQADFNAVLERLGVEPTLTIPRGNVTAGREADYRSYYTPEARAIVEKAFAPDLEQFGYEF
ncbi:MAG: hypothetical protein WKF43_07695 [Acidimicrobiales bacterium]